MRGQSLTTMQTDNFINGRYFAELIKEVIGDLEESKFQMVIPLR